MSALNNSKRIYDEAKKYLGVKEVPGKASHPLISEWIRQSANWLNPNDDETAWCGCFRGAVGLATGTGVPASHFRARNWMDWGRPVASIEEAIPGDTVILVRRGGFHVALFDRLQNGIWLLGGNQSNMVNIARYSKKDLLGVRRG